MTARFFALLTNIGAAKLANATALCTCLEITQMAVGDGGGILPTPNPAQIKLVNEQRRAALNMLTVDPVNASQIIAEQVIPETEGGWWIREIGLLDKDGDLIAIANCAETYKPQLQEGSGRTQTIRVILIVSSTAAVTLKIDPSVVLATRKYVDDRVIEVKTYADELMAAHLAALGEGSALPVGVPVPWPSATPPTGWLKCNGAAFTASQYPKLALAYPALRLPDLRGEFIRGWDDGREIDSGRAILTPQYDALQNHYHFITTMGAKGVSGSGVPSPTDDTGRIGGADAWLIGAGNWTTYGSPSGRVSEETRPRNIAFNYIVRAV